MIEVLLIEPDSVRRSKLVDSATRERDITLVKVLGDLPMFAPLLPITDLPRVALVNLDKPGMTSVRKWAEFYSAFPAIIVIAMTSGSSLDSIATALAMRVSAILHCQITPTLLWRAVREVFDGRSVSDPVLEPILRNEGYRQPKGWLSGFVGSRICPLLSARAAQAESVSHEPVNIAAADRRLLVEAMDHAGVDLTSRELEVLERVARGDTNPEIGARLGITVRTVRFHLENIFQKLGTCNRTGAVRVALKRGWIHL